MQINPFVVTPGATGTFPGAPPMPIAGFAEAMGIALGTPVAAGKPEPTLPATPQTDEAAIDVAPAMPVSRNRTALPGLLASASPVGLRGLPAIADAANVDALTAPNGQTPATDSDTAEAETPVVITMPERAPALRQAPDEHALPDIGPVEAPLSIAIEVPKADEVALRVGPPEAGARSPLAPDVTEPELAESELPAAETAPAKDEGKPIAPVSLPAAVPIATPVVIAAATEPQTAPMKRAGAPEKATATTPAKSPTAHAAPDALPTEPEPTAFARAFSARADASDSAKDDPGSSADADPLSVRAHETRPAPAFMPGSPARQSPSASASAPALPADPVIEARTGQLGQSLGVEIARSVEAGDETLRVRLNPAELGRVEVTLRFDDGGSLKATVRTEHSHSLDLLRHDMPDLARTLDQAGIRTEANSFRFEARADSSGGGESPQHQQHQQRGSQHQQQHADEPDPAYRAIRGDGQVDLLA